MIILLGLSVEARAETLHHLTMEEVVGAGADRLLMEEVEGVAWEVEAAGEETCLATTSATSSSAIRKRVLEARRPEDGTAAEPVTKGPRKSPKSPATSGGFPGPEVEVPTCLPGMDTTSFSCLLFAVRM